MQVIICLFLIILSPHLLLADENKSISLETAMKNMPASFAGNLNKELDQIFTNTLVLDVPNEKDEFILIAFGDYITKDQYKKYQRGSFETYMMDNINKFHDVKGVVLKIGKNVKYSYLFDKYIQHIEAYFQKQRGKSFKLLYYFLS